ncbi:hypothetical protein BDZ91DRAFT_851079 [Kalaharituber pfeilii]|nr:hypothetical protein BDZ91DRAFT_851079 [Kalaharituber pfeilii]
MEAAGLAIGIVGLAGQLARISRECYAIFSQMKEIGNAHDAVLHDLQREGLRLKRWEHAWGLDSTSSQQSQCLDPSDERYRFAVASLARIVAVFTKVVELQAIYQGEPEKDDKHGKQGEQEKDDKHRKRDNLGFGHLLSRFRSKSLCPGTSNDSQPASPNPHLSTPSLNSGDLSLLENPKILANKQLLPGLDEEIASLNRVAQNIQQFVPTYRKLRWASMDKTRCEELVGRLTKYFDGLFDVLPPDDTVSRMSQTRPPNLSFDIPFSLPEIQLNSDFVGRKHLLEQLRRKIEEGAAKTTITQVVLYGMGGIGKTQLALAYVYHYSQDYSSVFWINAASEQTTKISFTHIMQQLIKHHAKLSDNPDYTQIGWLLGMAGKLDSTGKLTVQQPSDEEHIVNSVKEWFTAKGNTKWLLVIDNLDDLESFNINDYIPSAPHGTVVITSRRPESIQGRRGLEVQQMDNSEAEELLFKTAKLDFEKLPHNEQERVKEVAATIVQKLECLPLAIAQAGAYIHVRKYSFSRYLREYNANVAYLLSKDWMVGKHDRSVFAAWDLSFKAIQNQSPKAAELLLLCGFFDNNDICEGLLQRGMKLPIDDTNLEDLIQILFSYSMANRIKGQDDSFGIHPLVHLWAQRKLEVEPERHNKKATEAFLIIASAITTPKNRGREVKEWVFERRILPHIIAIERQMNTLSMENKEVLEAVGKLYTVYLGHRYLRKAEEMCKVILAGNEKLLGTDHPDTFAAVHDMAQICYEQGQYNEALEFYERALAGREKALGADYSDTLTTVDNLALALGADHPDTLSTVDKIARVFHEQGQYNEALEFYERALAGREKALGTDHPDTLTTFDYMARVFRVQGQYNKALELYERALAGREKALSTNHPDTLETVNNIAVVFDRQGQYNKALALHERALVGTEKALGADHPATLTMVNNMAVVFANQRQYNKALALYERALTGKEKALGADHPSTLTTVRSMANLFERMGHFNKAQKFRERASGGGSANATH